MPDNFYIRNGFIQPGDLVFDIGVKLGKITDRLLDAGARVICVEPLPERVDFMREKYGDAITVVSEAVSDVGDRWGILHVSSKDKLNPTIEPDIYVKQFERPLEMYDEQRYVWMTTLDDLIETYGLPAFIKLDIEGSEYKAIKGLTAKVRALSFEFGMGYIEEAHKCVEELGARDYEFNYEAMHKGHLELDQWRPAAAFEFELPAIGAAGKYNWGNVYARLRGDDEGD